MADFQEALGDILNDPEKMKTLMSMAGSLGLGAPPAPSPAGTAPQAAPNARYEALLQALKPFLRPERRGKLDRAMQAARLSKLAGQALAMQNPDQKPDGEDKK